MTSGWNEALSAPRSTAAGVPAAPWLARWEALGQRYFGAIALAVTAIVILAEWVPVLFGGLWLDETFTYWQAYRGWHNALNLVSFSPGVSPLFAAICSLFFVPGPHVEMWLRIPAFAGMLLAAYFLFRLTDSWFGRPAAWLALVMFVSQKDIINRATEARPYGVALAMCLGLMYGLHVWLEERRAWGWVLFVISTALIPYWHFLFCYFLVTPAFYLLCRLMQGRPLPWLKLAGSALLIFAAWIPLRGQFLAIQAKGYTLSFTDAPNFDTFLETLLPERFEISALLAFLVAYLLFHDSFASPPPSSGRRWRTYALVAVVWMFCGPIELAISSKLKGYGMLVERYTLYTVAGTVLVAIAFFARLQTYRARLAALVIFAGISIAGAANQHWRGPSMGSWREPAAAIAKIDPSGSIPVLFASGFVESNFLDWRHTEGWQTHLYAPLLVYPVRNKYYQLPYKLDDPARSYTQQLLDGELRGQPRLLLLAYMPSDLTRWLTWEIEDRGYRAHPASPDNVVLLEFDAVNPPTPPSEDASTESGRNSGASPARSIPR